MSKIMRFFKWIEEEVIHALPAIIFFIITFNIIMFTHNLILESHGLHRGSYLAATIGALIVGKLLIIVNAFPFINAFPNKPLIYNIVWKSFVYSSAALLYRIIDLLIQLLRSHQTWLIAFKHFKQQLESPVFWSIQIWLLMLFLIYVVFSEFTRVIGKTKVIKLLLG